jgi:hypothetical protein
LILVFSSYPKMIAGVTDASILRTSILCPLEHKIFSLCRFSAISKNSSAFFLSPNYKINLSIQIMKLLYSLYILLHLCIHLFFKLLFQILSCQLLTNPQHLRQQLVALNTVTR